MKQVQLGEYKLIALHNFDLNKILVLAIAGTFFKGGYHVQPYMD